MSRHIPKRMTLFCGHYGSGKTNLAVNYAFWMKAQGLPVSIADLDVVNPYFRTGDSAEDLKEAGIDIVTLPFANSNVDLPALPSEIYGLVQRHDKYAVLDVAAMTGARMPWVGSCPTYWRRTISICSSWRISSVP